MKILYAASEAVPFIASGGLAEVAGALPKALCAQREDCRVVIPYYSDIKPQIRSSARYVTNFSVPLGWRNQYCGLFEAEVDGVTYYLLDNEYYFKRKGIYGFYDDAERFAFFSKAILEMLEHVDFVPEIIHCNDWQTALVPVYLNLYYRGVPKLCGVRTIFTIHNIQYQGKYGMELLGDVLGIPQYAASILSYDDCVNFMKGGIEESDLVSTVSPSYAQEILDPWFAHGLDAMLRDRQYKLSGILNGIDTVSYDPETDPNLVEHFSAKRPAGKRACKKALQSQMGLPVDGDAMVIGMVTRLVSHKGLDLVQYAFEEMLGRHHIQFVVLGSGDYLYENFFTEMQRRHPDQVAVRIGFIPELSRQIYAGVDAFLMPSKSEPCGLSQMVALRYGALPIVRETGGLRDSIKDLGGLNGNGFTFQTYNAHDMMGAVSRAMQLFEDKEEWHKAVVHALGCDFSWTRSAQQYTELYRRALGN